jgi:protein SCO1
MRQRIMSIAAMGALLLASAVLSAGGAWAAPEGSPWGANYFPNVPLVTQDGDTVRFYDDLLKGKTVVVNFIYTNCAEACGLETARLVQVQKLLGDRVGRDIFMYSISVDPQRDTPVALKAYANKFHTGPGWFFLTGKKTDVDLISKKFGLNISVDSGNRNDHSTSLMIGNETTGQWIKNSALDDPQYLATMIGDWMSNWKNRKPVRSYAEVRRLTGQDKGQYLFRTRCSACHTLGQGDALGPDLAGVTGQRERAWLARYLAAPDRMLAEGDPIATALHARYGNIAMPNLHLDAAEVAALLTYLQTQSAARHDDHPHSHEHGSDTALTTR